VSNNWAVQRGEAGLLRVKGVPPALKSSKTGDSGVEKSVWTSSRKLGEVDNTTRQNYNNDNDRNMKGGAYMPNEMGKRYRCVKCGAELIVTRAGTGKVVCCKQPMEKKT
jgi:desulfoferrodoxin-like iron-binding protein